MGEHDGSKLFMLRVHNSTRSCVLMKRFIRTEGVVWTMPVVSMPYDEDPMNYLHAVLRQVGQDDNFKVISAVSMVDYKMTDKNDIDHHSIVYDLLYAGKVLPSLTEEDSGLYAESKWVQKGMIGQYIDKCNYPLYAYIKAAEKEECLR